MFGFGGAAGRALGENFSVNAGFKLYTGSAKIFTNPDKTQTVSEDVSGYQLTLGLTASM